MSLSSTLSVTGGESQTLDLPKLESQLSANLEFQA